MLKINNIVYMKEKLLVFNLNKGTILTVPNAKLFHQKTVKWYKSKQWIDKKTATYDELTHIL